MTVQEIIEKVIGVEGRYSNNPKDSGGETCWGITIAAARRYGYTGAMRDMPKSAAVRIYDLRFMRTARIGDLNPISSRVCHEVFDTAVNCGEKVAIQFLQRSLNVLNREGRDYTDLVTDGQIGSKTLAALTSFLKLRKLEGEVVLLKILNSLQGAHYVLLAERRSKDEEFIFGWFRTRIDIPLASM